MWIMIWEWWKIMIKNILYTHDLCVRDRNKLFLIFYYFFIFNFIFLFSLLYFLMNLKKWKMRMFMLPASYIRFTYGYDNWFKIPLMYSTPVVILCFYSNILYTIFFVFFVISLKKFLSTNIIFLLIAFLAALWISTLWSVFFSFAVRNHGLSTNFIHLSIICTFINYLYFVY